MKSPFVAALGGVLGALLGVFVFRALDEALVTPADWAGLFIAALAGTVAGAVVADRAARPNHRRFPSLDGARRLLRRSGRGA